MFKDNAPLYWAKGLPAMPLRPVSKIPALNAWQSFCAAMPSEQAREAWLDAYADGNIGLPLGPQAGIVAVDLDSEDPRVQRVLDQLLPPSPWKRVGKKGAVYAFKYNGERTYRIKGEDGGTLLEVLSRGAQIVLPPSIHPDTGRPYEANAKLYEVLDKLQPLPAQFEELVRRGLIDSGIKLQQRGSTKVTDWVPAGGRDSQMTSVAGMFARDVIKGDRPLLEAINMMEAWVHEFTEKVVGDAMDPDKAKKKLMEFVRRDVTEHGKQLPPGWNGGMNAEETAEFKRYFGEEVEEWTQKQYLDHLHEKFLEFPREDVVNRTMVVDDVMLRLSRSQILTEIDHDAIIQFISLACGRMVSVASMRKRIRDLKKTGIEGKDHTEIAQALIEELNQFGEVRFHAGSFYQWAGSHWRLTPEEVLLKALAEQFGHLDAAKRHSDHKGIIRTVQTLVTRPLRGIDGYGINFANGWLTTDQQLQEHHPAYGATYVLPYRYMPEGPAPLRFLAFLDSCFGQDPDYEQQVQAVRQVIAATLFGAGPRFSRAACFFGPPKSGKSTLLDIILGLIPDGARCSVRPQDWDDRFMPAQMAGKLVNMCGELSETTMIPGDLFKLIVEGQEISGQHKGLQIFTFRPSCMHVFASNHLPKTRDTSAGFNRRWLFLHFRRSISESQKILRLQDEILAEEREAIATWAVPAIQDLMRQQEYTLSRGHVDLIAEMATQNNSVRFFLTSGQVIIGSTSPDANNASNRTREKDLYPVYYAYCKISANAQPVQLKRFRLAMQELASEMDFRLSTAVPSGDQEVWYENVTLVKKAA